MKTRSIFLLLVLVMLIPSKSNAQGWILRRAIDRKIDQKVDSAVDKSAQDKAKEKEQTDKNQTDKTSTTEKKGTKETGRGLFGAKIDTKYEDQYKFTGRIYMQMETYDKKDVMKSDYYTYYNSNSLNAGIEMLPLDSKSGDKTYPTVFLFDNDNRCFMMIIENKDSKTGIISTMPSDSAIATQAKTQKAPEKATITKT
ncbi:MAG TPA: hypothetical protein VF346_03915, partial [Bacteroidales bacterium]